jgi:hypothetical protein
MIRIILILGIFFSLASCKELECTDKIREKIHAIPENDRKVLDEFFKYLLFFQGFAYTLFGDKPISEDSFDLEKNPGSTLFATSCEGYLTWKKYENLFPSTKYLFLFYENIDKESCEITLVNKAALQKVFKENKEKFIPLLGPKVNSETILSLLKKNGSLWNTSISDREDLAGILLGFGKHNAELFQKRAEISSKKPTLKQFRTQPSLGFDSIEQELSTLHSQLQSFDGEGRYSLCFMRLPGFVAERHHRETKQLMRKYRQQRKYITKLFAQGNVLEITLKQLCD